MRLTTAITKNLKKKTKKLMIKIQSLINILKYKCLIANNTLSTFTWQKLQIHNEKSVLRE